MLAKKFFDTTGNIAVVPNRKYAETETSPRVCLTALKNARRV
jgi:hypothetical protein